MKDDKTRGYVILGAIGLLWFTLATTTPATWRGGHLFILTLAASLLTPYALGLLGTLGLDRITRFALDAIRYGEEQHFNSFVLWNKIWVRSLPWWLAFFLVKKYTGWGSLVFIGYAGWALYRHYRQSRPQTVSIDPQQGGFVFQTGDGPLWVANPYRGTFINGGPGSGKSKSLVSQSDSGTSYSQSRNVQQRDRLEAQAVMRFEQGEFAGILAEGSHAEFRRYFVAPHSQAQPLKPFQQASQADTRQQFSRIKDQVNGILASSQAQETPANAPRSGEQAERRTSTAPAGRPTATPSVKPAPAQELPGATQPTTAPPEPEDWQNFM